MAFKIQSIGEKTIGFEAIVREGGGKVDVVTIPKFAKQLFGIKRGSKVLIAVGKSAEEFVKDIKSL